MTTSFFARVALLTFAAGAVGACGDSITVTPTGGKCEIDAQCGPRAFCFQGICVIDFREDLAMQAPPDYSMTGIPNPDFAGGGGGGGDLGGCPNGTKRCGMQCIPNGWCCTNNDCAAAGQTCQIDGTCQCPQMQKACLQTCIPNGNCCTNDDCPSKLCNAGMCAVPACADGVPNGNETDVDCGGGFCGKCLVERNCGLALDCRSNTCTGQVCKEPGFIKTPYGGASQPSFIRTGDFNNDGNLDLITLNTPVITPTFPPPAMGQAGSQNLSVMLGLGNGSFQSIGTFATGLGPINADIGDLNGDKRLDVVVANYYSNTISVLLGAGDGTFLPQVTYGVGAQPVWVSIGDQNKDGRADIVVSNFVTSSFGLLLGNGNGTFKAQVQTFTWAQRPRGIVLKDFNNDGMDDVAVQQVGVPPPGTVGFNTGVISVYLSKMGGGFELPRNYATATTLLTSLYAQDLNADGKTDLIVGSVSLTTPQIFNGTGAGTFQLAGALLSAYFPYVGFADLNGDKIVDIVSSSGTQLGNGNGSFQPNIVFQNAGAGIPALAVGDFNKDGKIDLAYPVPASNWVNVLFGNGDGTIANQSLVAPFSGSQTDVALESPRVVNLSDLNGDGRADLLVAGGTVGLVTTPGLFVHIANSNGTLQLPSVYAIGTGANPTGIAVNDFNNDKNPDVVVSNGSETSMYLLSGNANGTLNPAVKIAVPTTMQTLNAGDLNNDGNMDVVLATTATQVYYLLGKGDGTFNNPVPLTVGTQPRQIFISDFNGDMNLDIVTVNRGSSNLSYLISKGVDLNGVLSFNTVLTQAPPGMPAPAPIAAGISDLDGDTLPDLVIADNAAAFVRVYINKTVMGGAITFGPPTSYATLAVPISAVMADFNQDGKMDFATANNVDRSVSVFMGLGMGKFSQMTNHDVGIGPVWIAAGDINGDKKPDLATANQTAGTATILLNTGMF